MAGQIIIVNGTSGSGKTTTCRNIARRSQQPYLLMGIDLLTGTMYPAKYTMFGELKELGYQPTSYGPMCMKSHEALHAMIAAASRVGQNMLVDHLAFIDPPILQDLVWRLEGLPVLFVNLKPPLEVVEDRVANRTVVIPEPLQEAMNAAGPDVMKVLADELSGVTPWFYEHAYANDIYDLELDTSTMSPDEACEKIEARLSAGPGTAFDILRERYPRPA